MDYKTEKYRTQARDLIEKAKRSTPYSGANSEGDDEHNSHA